jgi:hypothetical protein
MDHNVAKPNHYLKDIDNPFYLKWVRIYNLRLGWNTGRNKAKLAKEYGVDGFIYYHHWFGGKDAARKPAESHA